MISHIFFILVWFYPNTLWLLLSSRTVCKIAQTSCWSALILYIWARERPHMENTGLIIRPQFSALFTWLPSGSNYCFSVTLIHKITLFSDSSTEWLSCSNVKSLYKMHKVEALSFRGTWIGMRPFFPFGLKTPDTFPILADLLTSLIDVVTIPHHPTGFGLKSVWFICSCLHLILETARLAMPFVWLEF